MQHQVSPNCWSRLSCFGSKRGWKRVAPASRIPEGNNTSNGPQHSRLPNQATPTTPSLLAPPSSPAFSTTNSAPPSTAQSPSCFLSANSPGGPSSTMFATGPYAHETQLVSPPVFSTYTTEPSTAPFTPSPELNHPTTPSSPEVPYAHFLSLQDTQNPRNPSSMFFGLHTASSKNFILSQDSSFLYPSTCAQFHLDQAHTGGRLSVSKEADVESSKNCKPDVEEIEAYRASFGFSADEIITTPNYVEITDDVIDDSFTISPFASNKSVVQENILPDLLNTRENEQTTISSLTSASDPKSPKQSDMSEIVTDEEDIFSRMSNSKINKRYQLGLSTSDAEIEYREGRSLRERKADFTWHD